MTSVKTLIHWWHCYIHFFLPSLPLNGIGTGVIANRRSLCPFFRADVAVTLEGVVGVCHLSLSHGAYLDQTIIEGGEMCCFLVCKKTGRVDLMLHISWLNQMGFWLLVVLLHVAIWPRRCLVHVFPSTHHLKELQQQMVNAQREHTCGTAFRYSQRPSVFTGEKIIEYASLTQWYAICPLPQNWRF